MRSVEPLKTVIVGMGPHGLRLVQAVSGVQQLALSAVVDRSPQALSSLDLPEGVARFTSTEQALAACKADVVCIATNGPSHAPLALQAMAAGARRLLVEKPMACSVRDCERMVATAEATGTRLSVDHPRRVSPVYRFLRERIASGDWGSLRFVSVQRPGIGLGCLGTHSFDLVRYLAGQDVTRVTAWVDPARGPNPRGAEFVDPGGLVVLELTAGTRASVVQIEDGAGPMSVELDLTLARVRLDEKSGELEVSERDPSVVPKPNQPAKYRTVLNPNGISAKRSLIGELTSLLQELATTDALSATGADGLASLTVMAAAYASHERGNVPVSCADLDDASRARVFPVT